MRIAYLVSRYPLPTHAFIQREIEGLRALGAEIHVLGLQRAAPEDVAKAGDQESYETTYTVRPLRLPRFAGAHLYAVLRHPLAYLRTLTLALRLPPGRRGRLSQLFYFAQAVPIWRECEKRDLTHIHAHFASPPADVAALAAKLGERSNGPATWSFTGHGTDMFDDVRPQLAEKVRRASMVVTVSDFGRSELMRLVQETHWPKIHVVRCGLEDRWFASSTRNGGQESPLRILTVARLVPEKGHGILLEALAELELRGVAVVVEIVGNGDRLQHLRRRAEELGVAHQVRFAGQVGQATIRDRYVAADVFCLPSFSEGLPVSLMEAMACELPVVASRIAGIPELVEDGVSGLLVAPGRADAFAAAIERLARQPDLRSEMGRAGRRKVMREFRIETSSERLFRAFSALLNDFQVSLPRTRQEVES